jgi:hypothetical protein
MNPEYEANRYHPANDDDWQPTGDDLDAESKWRKADKDADELSKMWRWIWEAPNTKRQSYVGRVWYRTRAEALKAGGDWLRSGSL